MRKRTLWFSLAGVVLLLLVLFGPALVSSFQDGQTDRYRTSTELVVSDNGREVRNAIVGECVEHRSSNWNTGTQHGVHRTGDEPFVVLPDRSFLMLRDIGTCLPSPVKAGDVFTFDANLTSGFSGDRVRMPYAHAWRFDNIDDPKVVRIYDQRALFRDGVDGLRVTEAKLAFAGRSSETPVPFAAEDAFPWLAAAPWAAVGKPDYAEHLHRSTFSGFEVSLNQLAETQRCNKFDKDVEGPVLVAGDVWDSCPPWGGENLGWLVAKPSADFSRIDYAYADRSLQHVSTLHRASWLAGKGAPGVREGNDFYWQPELCFDGFCVRAQAARRSTWEGFRLYYPRQNQVIAVRWKSPAVSNLFRRRDRAS